MIGWVGAWVRGGAVAGRTTDRPSSKEEQPPLTSFYHIPRSSVMRALHHTWLGRSTQRTDCHPGGGGKGQGRAICHGRPHDPQH